MGKTIVGVAVAMTVLAVWAAAQGSPRVISVDPAAGAVGTNCTVKGENLGKEKVAGVLLSDQNTDYPAVVVQESADTIVLKVPQVKPGDYNISLRIGNGIFIQPVRFTVQQSGAQAAQASQ